MTPLQRLLAEELPDGTFGGARSLEPAAHPTRRDPKTPDPQAAQHRRDLLAALDQRPARRRHLRVVADTDQTTDAMREAA